MIPFYSKRNQIYPRVDNSEAVVEKHFHSLCDWEKEVAAYELLEGKLPVPPVMKCRPCYLEMRYCAFPTILRVLEGQEREGFHVAPWHRLARWLSDCYSITGMLPSDPNLRNFLWDQTHQTIYGLDFESFDSVTPEECGAALIAYLLSYDPANTEVKQAAGRIMARELGVSDGTIRAATTELRLRRADRSAVPFSGIILAGGKSLRMGSNKAELMFGGETFLQHQIGKLRALGISDILVSGSGYQVSTDVRVIPDEYPDRGPMGGLHACLKAAENSKCVVLGVDVPLIPLAALAHMCRIHADGVTVLRHSGGEEPMIGVFDRDLYREIRPLIESGGASVRALKSLTPWNTFNYSGPSEYITNCNSPEDLLRTVEIAEKLAKYGLKI